MAPACGRPRSSTSSTPSRSGHRGERGEIWTVAGGPDYIGKPRPAVIIHDDAFNATASVTVCPFTTLAVGALLVRLAIVPSERTMFGGHTAELTRAAIQWTRRSHPADLMRPGDLIDVGVISLGQSSTATVSLEQQPIVEGALIAIDNRTGQVLAMVGGYSFSRSKFNRATQAHRQLG